MDPPDSHVGETWQQSEAFVQSVVAMHDKRRKIRQFDGIWRLKSTELCSKSPAHATKEPAITVRVK